MLGAPIRIGLDIDGVITYAGPFFKLLTERFKDVAEIHIITARTKPDDKDRLRILYDSEMEIQDAGIYYDAIAAPASKGEYIREKGIHVMFEDTDEEINCIPKSCLVFKVREEMNYCWETKRWLHSDKTSRHIDDLFK